MGIHGKIERAGLAVGRPDDNYLRVTAHAPEARWNQFDAVRLTAEGAEGLEGMICS